MLGLGLQKVSAGNRVQDGAFCHFLEESFLLSFLPPSLLSFLSSFLPLSHLLSLLPFLMFFAASFLPGIFIEQLCTRYSSRNCRKGAKRHPCSHALMKHRI